LATGVILRQQLLITNDIWVRYSSSLQCEDNGDMGYLFGSRQEKTLGLNTIFEV